MNPILDRVLKLASHAADESRPRPSVIEYATQALKLFGALRALEIGAVDSLLTRVGLGRREHTVSPLIWFAAGAVVGGGTALAFAPASGKQLRQRLARFLDPSHGVELEKPLPAKMTDGVASARKTNGGKHA